MEFDGSSTGQAPGDDSEVIVNLSVLKQYLRIHSEGVTTYWYTHQLMSQFLQTTDVMRLRFSAEVPWFGIEQEYTLLKKEEFDEGKISCCKGLAGHNRRRRKTHPENAANAVNSNEEQYL
ncbi:glutamine synthetase cytosolic isozyme-like [Daucus carota subsp. sativus]|uniref:glutamine synthetase cytosolic isozyme-like n=1 Tax=Daucus carota subsp. sativus TaxID=79200 RepID=UPI00308300BC